VISTGLEIPYSYLYRKYINRIHTWYLTYSGSEYIENASLDCE
jgi:hypothetical protein